MGDAKARGIDGNDAARCTFTDLTMLGGKLNSLISNGDAERGEGGTGEERYRAVGWLAKLMRGEHLPEAEAVPKSSGEHRPDNGTSVGIGDAAQERVMASHNEQEQEHKLDALIQCHAAR